MTDRLKTARILMLVPSLYRCGPMNDVLRLCRAYVAVGLKPHVVQLERPGSDSIEEDFNTIGINVASFGGWRWNLAAHALHLRSMIRREKIDMVHSFSLRPDLINSSLRVHGGNCKALSTALNIAIHDTSALIGKTAGRAAAALWIAAFRYMDATAAHSHGIYDYLRESGLPQNRLHVIPNGVDTEHFSPQNPDIRLETRRRLGIDADDFVIGFVGNFLPVKGLDIFLDAFSKNRNKGNARLLLIGDGPEESRLRKKAEDLGVSSRIVWIPRSSELRPYYAAMDLFCLPSRSEGLSNALLEAGASALPCLVTDISGSREVVENGLNGFVVPPENSSALAAAMNDALILRDDLPRMGGETRRMVVASYSAQAMAGSYMNLYRELLK